MMAHRDEYAWCGSQHENTERISFRVYARALVIPLYGDEAGHEVDMTYLFRLNNQPPPHQANRARLRNLPHNQIKDPRRGSQGLYAHRAGHARLA